MSSTHQSLKLSVVQKIALGLSVLVAICLLVIALGFVNASISNDRFRSYEQVLDYRKAIKQLESGITELQREMLVYRIVSSKAGANDLKNIIATIQQQVSQVETTSLLDNTQGREIISKIRTSLGNILKTSTI